MKETTSNSTCNGYPALFKRQGFRVLTLVVLLSGLVFPGSSMLQAQSCDCTDYLYLNDTDLEFIHKFAVDENNNGAVTEIGAPWFAGLTQSPQFTDPHGIAQDLNGNLYIAESSSGDIYQFDPFGNITLSPWLNNSSGSGFDAGTALRTVNYGFKDNVLYIHNNQHRYVYAIDLCTGNSLGRMELYPGADAVIGSGPVVWGFYVDNNNWYAVQRSNPGSVYTGPLDLSFYTTGFGTPANSGTLLFNLSEPATGTADGDENGMGITRDAAGNFYIIERQTISGTHNQPVLVKYSPTGTPLASVTAPADPLVGNVMNGVPGFSGARGVTYSSASDRVYVSSKVNCISVFQTDLTELSALNYGNPMNGRPKAIGVVTECCATPSTQNINNTVCYDGVNDETIFLQEVLDCEGIIAEGTWAETADANGVFDYESCDNSITVTGTGCATYTLTADGTGTNNQCGAFSVTVEICTTDPPTNAAPVTAQGTCSGSTANNDASVTIGSITNADVAGITLPGNSSYNGPIYNSDPSTNPNLFDVSSGTLTLSNLEHGQTYVVRLFNMGNGCSRDVVFTTPTIDCGPSCPFTCETGESLIAWNDMGWNGGTGWVDGDDGAGADPNNALLTPQTYTNFDGMGNNITATFSGNTPSGGDPGPNVYAPGGNTFGCDGSLRLTGSTSANSIATMPTETITFDNAIEMNQFYVGGMDQRFADPNNTAEVSVLLFSNNGTPIDPSTFIFTPFDATHVDYQIDPATSQIFVYGLTDNTDGAMAIDLGGALVDEIVWSVGNITGTGNEGTPADWGYGGSASSQWITGFCYAPVSCVSPTAVATPAAGTCVAGAVTNNATIDLTMVMNGDEAGISAGSTYTGPDYGDAANIDVSGGTGSFTGLMHNTQYTIRVFNMDNGCNVDYTVTTPDLTLPTVTLNDPADVCIDGSDMNFTATPPGGSFSTTAAAGFTPNNAAGTAVLDVSAAGAGTYDVTYTFTDGNGCEASQTVSV
ncbi:MAG: hypothetical protein NXI25_04025, partial [bacterium]|nr:hypothetical protein [bacterium]